MGSVLMDKLLASEDKHEHTFCAKEAERQEADSHPNRSSNGADYSWIRVGMTHTGQEEGAGEELQLGVLKLAVDAGGEGQRRGLLLHEDVGEELGEEGSLQATLKCLSKYVG